MTGVIEITPLSAPPDATVRVPGSKSLTNRALVCALLADGRSVITGALDADDTRAMADAVRALGADVQWVGDTVMVDGTGGELPPSAELHVRDSGTCARFLAPVLARGRGRYLLDGSDQLRRRPMGPMVDALRQLGVEVESEVEGDGLPLVIHGRGEVPEGQVEVPGDVSSQFISGLMLAGFDVRPAGNVVSRPYVAMTEHVLAAFARGATQYAVEPDATAASYFFAAAAVFPEGRVTVQGLGRDSVQGDMAFVDLLAERGCLVERDERSTTVIGPTALVPPAAPLHLTDTPDVAQTLAAVAVFGPLGTPWVVRGIAFARGHETDRVSAVVTELRRCGIAAQESADGFAVDPGTPHPAEIETYGDHRMAMSFSLLGLKAPGIRIKDPACVNKTFPEFFSVLETLRR